MYGGRVAGTPRRSAPSALLPDNEQVTVVDVGAAAGIHPRFQLLRPHLRAVLFEPDKVAYDELVGNGSSDTVYNFALAETNDVRKFHITRKGQLSSFYRPRAELFRDFPEPDRSAIEREFEVETRSLDSIAETTPAIDFIKLDTQGAELEILRGGARTLGTVWGLEIEVEFTPVYEDQPLFCDVDRFAREHQFELFDLRHYYWARKAQPDAARTAGQLVFADALYFKNQEAVESILAAMQAPADRRAGLGRLLSLLYVYRRNDYALHLLEALTAEGLVDLDGEEREQIRQAIVRNHDAALPSFRGNHRIRAGLTKLGGLFRDHMWYRVDPDL